MLRSPKCRSHPYLIRSTYTTHGTRWWRQTYPMSLSYRNRPSLGIGELLNCRGENGGDKTCPHKMPDHSAALLFRVLAFFLGQVECCSIGLAAVSIQQRQVRPEKKRIKLPFVVRQIYPSNARERRERRTKPAIVEDHERYAATPTHDQQ